ncbi:hypothetical protein BJ912DRAFT_1100883 [Pholiota molesta]|nr:hypothetical protein BJ912DRAFT_1100883 [Pholiota molesta]
MITICRAEDGQVFHVNASVRDIEGIGSLELFLHQEIGVDEDAALAYLSDGRRITSANIRDLASVQDQFIFVFNKYYLDYDVDVVLRQLQVEPRLQPTIEDAAATTPPIRHAQIAASYARTAQLHHEHVQHLLQSISLQHKALQIASNNLDFHVLAISETFDNIAVNGRKELEKQASLLDGLDADLELISRVTVHVEFCSAAVRMAIEAGEPHRVLADYVSKPKMKQVADTCAKTHDELQLRFSQVEEAVVRIKGGADSVRSMIGNVNLFEEAQTCSRRSQDLLDRITDTAGALESPASDSDHLLQDLKQLDNAHRQEVQQITNKKNLYTRQCLTVLRHISTLNNEMVHLPPALSMLAASFRAKTSFPHIQRLHNMLYAYGTTVIEIVRRKEFSNFFYQRAQSILEVMAKISASERKRRQVYRGEVNGQLPFETKGMDDPVPTIDFSPDGGLDSPYSFERSDVDYLMRILEDLETAARSSNATMALKAVRESRAALQKQINKMDGLELAFDKLAERTLLSQSRLSQSRRRSTEAEERAIQELAEELRATQEAKSQQERAFQEERSQLQAEIHRLKSASIDYTSSLADEQERSTRLERELHQVRVARRILEERNVELSADISKQSNEIAHQTKEAERLRQQLAQVEVDLQEVKQLEQRNADKVNHLLKEQANTLRHLEEARSRGENLEHQIQAARAESEQVVQALQEASQEKDRLLRAQMSEHDRIIRDHIAEADGDRAVLDRQFSEVQAVLEHKERELKDLRGDLEVANADAVGLREELQRVEHELREARHVERLLRDDLKAGPYGGQQQAHRQILEVAISFRNSHVKALHTAQSLNVHPNSARHNTENLAGSTFSVNGFRHGVIPHHDEPSPIDPSDPAAALDLLREFDHDHFLEAVAKTGTTIRKWQKQCKEYRERAKGKISFRNFAKGDLALFLPTRNSVSKPWAAFNVSFPHYFLQATGHLAEQLKTREWIVARITSITERVVDHKVCASKLIRYGVKYYMLEVEDWTQPTHNNKRRVSGKKALSDNETKEAFQATGKLSPSALPPAPPEADVEDTFEVTHPPNSHLFPTRARANSSPSARPSSSLSRLLAQASPAPEVPADNNTTSMDNNNVLADNNASDTTPEIRSPSSPPTSPPPPPSPSLPVDSPPRNATLNNMFRRFSVGRVPALAPQTKAAPTTALSEQALAVSPSTTDNNPFMSPTTPSPQGLFQTP